MNDLIIQNIQELILPKSTDKPLKGRELDELEVVDNGTVVIKDGKWFTLDLIQMTMRLKRSLMLVVKWYLLHL